MPFLQRWLILATLSSALFLIVVDMTVLYIALPRLTLDLGASAAEKLWIINIYPLVVSGLLLGCGTLGDKLGHKRLFVSGLVVFGVASLGAAYSSSAAQLIGFRVLLAVGAAMMMPATLSLIRLTFEDERERSMAIGIWASVAAGGAAFGPLLGGLLLEYFWWGSVFLINLPIVMIALALAIGLIPAGRGDPARRWDLLGSLQFMAALVGLTYAIKELGRPGSSYAAAVAAALLGALMLWTFVRRQRRRAEPLIDFALFRHRPFTAAVLAALATSAALIGMELALSQRLQLVLGRSPLQAGLYILPLPLAAFCAGPLAGWALPRLGRQRVLGGALLLAAVGMASFALLFAAALPIQVASLIAVGFGLGAAMTAASNAIMHGAAAADAGMVASIEEVSFELGGALGVTLMGTLLSAVYSAGLLLPETLDAPALVRDSLDQALIVAERLPTGAAEELRRLARGAFDRAFVAVLAAAAALLAAAALTNWRYAREKSDPPLTKSGRPARWFAD